MSERFEVSPIRLRPDADGSVSVKSGAITIRAEAGDGGGGTERVPVPPPKVPPWRVKLRRRGELLLELPNESGMTEEELEQAVAEQDAVDEVTVDADAGTMTRRDLAPLVRLSRRYGVDVDVHLHGDG